MPLRHARALAPVATTLLAGLAAVALGLGRRSPVRPGVPMRRRHLEPEAEPPPAWGVRRTGPTKLWRSAILAVVAVMLLGAAGIYAMYEIGAAQKIRTRAVALTAGDPDRGRELVRRYGCAGCHTIPGVPGAKGQVGPSLQGFAARVYVAGVAKNSPDTLMQWIENPRSIDPKTAMPVTGISGDEVRHVAAYLYTLR